MENFNDLNLYNKLYSLFLLYNKLGKVLITLRLIFFYGLTFFDFTTVRCFDSSDTL